jgi:hypothetical protein
MTPRPPASAPVAGWRAVSGRIGGFRALRDLLEAGGGCGRTEGADARGLQAVDQSGGQRIIRTDHDKSDFFPLRESNDCIQIGGSDRNILGEGGRARIAGCAEDALHARRLLKFPNQGVLAPSPADDEGGHA